MTPHPTTTPPSAGSARGRKRDDSRTAAIIEATQQLLQESGFDHLTIQAVADRAGSGTGAIYRRWSTKEGLIADAIRALPDHEPDETDDPVADLRRLVRNKIETLATAPDLLTGAVTAIRTSPEIASAMRDRYNDDVLRRGIARVLGEHSPHLPLLASLPTALTLHQATFLSDIDDPDHLADQILDLILGLRDTAS